MDLQGKKILVTGAAGFVGSHVIDRLLDEGCAKIIGVDNMQRGQMSNLSSALESGRVEFDTIDIRDKAAMAPLVKGTDVLFHFAAPRITQCAEEPRLAIETMVEATFNLLEQCVENKVSKVVASSSASVYGMADAFPTTEAHHPYSNRTLYGAAKAFNEGLLRSFHDMYGLDYVALRYFNIYGPRMDIHGVYTEVMVRWMERIAAGEPPLIFGDGHQTMDFIDVDDVARANVLAAKSDVTDDVFNVATGTETSLRGLADMMLSVMGSKASPEFREARSVNGVERRLADTSHASRAIGFNAEIPLDAGLARLVDWWKTQ